MSDARNQASETGERFQRELQPLLARYVNGADEWTQASIGGCLLAEAVGAAIRMGLPLDAVASAVRAMYAEHEALRKKS